MTAERCALTLTPEPDALTDVREAPTLSDPNPNAVQSPETTVGDSGLLSIRHNHTDRHDANEHLACKAYTYH